MVNCMNDSEEFYSRESFQVLDLCWAATKACDLIHGICLGHRETFRQSTSCNRFITDTSSRNSSLYESKCQRCNPSAEKCRATFRGRWRTNWEHNTNADVCKMAVNHEFFLTSGSSTEFCGCTAKIQISELQFDKFPTHLSFSYWKIRNKTRVSSCSDFPSEAMLWIKEVEMVASVDKTNPRDQLRVRISRIWKCWTRELLLLWTR